MTTSFDKWTLLWDLPSGRQCQKQFATIDEMNAFSQRMADERRQRIERNRAIAERTTQFPYGPKPLSAHLASLNTDY